MAATHVSPAEAASNRWFCSGTIEGVRNAWTEFWRNRRLRVSQVSSRLLPADVVAVRARPSATARLQYSNLAVHALRNAALIPELSTTLARDASAPATQEALRFVFLTAIQDETDLRRMLANDLFVGSAEAGIKFLADNVRRPHHELGITIDEPVAGQRIRALIASSLIANNFFYRSENYLSLMAFLGQTVEGVPMVRAVDRMSPDVFTWASDLEAEDLSALFAFVNELAPTARATALDRLQHRAPRTLLVQAVGLVHQQLLVEVDPETWVRGMVVYTDLIERVTADDLREAFAVSAEYRQIKSTHFDVRSPILKSFFAIVFTSYRGPESEHPLVTIYATQMFTIQKALNKIQ